VGEEMSEFSFFMLMGALVLGQIGVVLVGLSIGYRRGFQVGKKDGKKERDEMSEEIILWDIECFLLGIALMFLFWVISIRHERGYSRDLEMMIYKNSCDWINNNSYWETQCGLAYQCLEGTPKENGMLYCPFCGGKLLEKKKEYEE
jgi:hypothetical protein